MKFNDFNLSFFFTITAPKFRDIGGTSRPIVRIGVATRHGAKEFGRLRG
jgi:hypothetical protein